MELLSLVTGISFKFARALYRMHLYQRKRWVFSYFIWLWLYSACTCNKHRLLSVTVGSGRESGPHTLACFKKLHAFIHHAASLTVQAVCKVTAAVKLWFWLHILCANKWQKCHHYFELHFNKYRDLWPIFKESFSSFCFSCCLLLIWIENYNEVIYVLLFGIVFSLHSNTR